VPLTVAIVEDDRRWRANLEMLLRETEGIKWVASCATAEIALADLSQRKPDVILMDINLPKMSGVECTRQLKALLPQTQVIMLTAYDDNDLIFQALQAGANGYLLKRASADEIVEAIREVRRGGAPMSTYIARKVVQSFQQPSPVARPDDGLSKREIEVLNCVARGFTDKEVADALGLSVATIRSYLKTIYGKLHVHSRLQAVQKVAFSGGPEGGRKPD
jgi:DNA-binding NarL/FixJ family response regulator